MTMCPLFPRTRPLFLGPKTGAKNVQNSAVAFYSCYALCLLHATILPPASLHTPQTY